MNKRFKLGYTTGVYDMFHVGHLNILRRAKEQCDTLIVGVTTDELCYRRKHKYPIINEKDRMAIVEAIRYVDKVVVQSDMDKLHSVKELGADAVVGVRYGSSQVMSGAAEVIAYGTAVKYITK